MTGSPEVAVVKPNFGTNGGFERHVAGLVAGLRERGWSVTVLETEGSTSPDLIYGLPIEGRDLEAHWQSAAGEYCCRVSIAMRIDQPLSQSRENTWLL